MIAALEGLKEFHWEGSLELFRVKGTGKVSGYEST